MDHLLGKFRHQPINGLLSLSMSFIAEIKKKSIITVFFFLTSLKQDINKQNIYWCLFLNFGDKKSCLLFVLIESIFSDISSPLFRSDLIIVYLFKKATFLKFENRRSYLLLFLRCIYHGQSLPIISDFYPKMSLFHFFQMYGLNFKSLEIYSLASICFNCTQHGPSLVNIWDPYEKITFFLKYSLEFNFWEIKCLASIIFLTLHIKANLWWKSETSTQKWLIFHFLKNMALISKFHKSKGLPPNILLIYIPSPIFGKNLRSLSRNYHFFHLWP